MITREWLEPLKKIVPRTSFTRELYRQSYQAGTAALRVFSPLMAIGRARPDFIIVGAQKCGTTSMYAVLSQHAQIMPARRKECEYFEYRFGYGQAWYLTHFPYKTTLKRRSKSLGKPVMTGESTPFYLLHPDAATRIHAFDPNMKIMVVAREPVARAVSNYNFSVVRRKLETRTFLNALDEEPDRPGVDEMIRKAEAGELEGRLPKNFYRASGEYADQIERYMALFGRKNVHVCFTEDMRDNPQKFYAEAQRFLGIEVETLETSQRKNRGTYIDDGEEVRARLEKHYKPHNQALRELLGCQLPWDES